MQTMKMEVKGSLPVGWLPASYLELARSLDLSLSSVPCDSALPIFLFILITRTVMRHDNFVTLFCLCRKTPMLIFDIAFVGA